MHGISLITLIMAGRDPSGPEIFAQTPQSPTGPLMEEVLLSKSHQIHDQAIASSTAEGLQSGFTL
jgi:hypothetical protein